MTAASLDTAGSADYVTDALYRELIANFSGWQDDTRAVADPVARETFRMLLEREARLLDQLKYEDWLALYTTECIYWVPSTPNAGDPRREIAVMFDDRRRLEDRIKHQLRLIGVPKIRLGRFALRHAVEEIRNLMHEAVLVADL